MSETFLYRDVLPGGATWSGVVRRHHVLTLRDVEGGANVTTLFYNRDLLLERYNMPDTLKAQYTAFLTAGRVLMSDMGRALLSIVGDTCGWHDAIGGHSDAEGVAAKYGRSRYQEARNDFHRNGHDNLLVELGKWGLGKRDLVPNLNFFSKVTADDDGRLAFVSGHSKPGAEIALRAEMNVLVVLTAVQHPLDPAPEYAPRQVEITVAPGSPPAPDDPCRVSRAEAARALENAERFFL